MEIPMEQKLENQASHCSRRNIISTLLIGTGFALIGAGIYSQGYKAGQNQGLKDGERIGWELKGSIEDRLARRFEAIRLENVRKGINTGYNKGYEDALHREYANLVLQGIEQFIETEEYARINPGRE